MTTVFAQTIDNYLAWDSHPITWDDFKGLPDETSVDDATLVFTIRMNTKYLKKDSIALIIENLMLTDKSWTRTDSDSVLMHERRHFDLAEVYARKMRKQLLEFKFKYSSISKEIDNIYKPLRSELDYMQKKYDSETNHSKNRIHQVNWDNRIKEELKRLEKYNATIVPLSIDWKR